MCLTPGLLSATSPRISPDGRLLAFLSFETAASTGVHAATAELLTLPWPPPGAFQALLVLQPSRLCQDSCLHWGAGKGPGGS